MSLLITLEGIDGSGKTTLISNLKKSGELDLITHNWRDTEWGQKIWHLLDEARGAEKNGLPSDWSYIFLILVAFDELVKKVVRPDLWANKVVVIDRYIDSTLVYQGLAGGLEISTIQEVAKKTIDLPWPDITFVLDIDPVKAQQRLKKRELATGEYTNWDKLDLEFHQQIRNHYRKLKELFPERIYVVDAEKSEKEILTEVQNIIKQTHAPKNEADLPQFVRVIIQNEKGEFLLVKDKNWGWNFPGGKIEFGETPEDAAKREVFEETNLAVDNLEKVGERNVFYANLPEGKQHWKGYFFQTKKYAGQMTIKETDKILGLNFVGSNSSGTEIKDSRNWAKRQQPYQFYLEKIRNFEKYPNNRSSPEKIKNGKKTLIIIAGGSGTGKTTVKNLLAQNPDIAKLVSTTTRPPREGEKDGQDYYFIGKEEFQAELEKGRFLEHIIYDENYYGIQSRTIDLALGAQNKHGVITVDVKGLRQVKKYCQKKGYNTVSYWFKAESREKMAEHMKKRGTSEPEILRRLIIAEKEEKFAVEFDCILTIKENDLAAAVQKIRENLLQGISKKN